MVIDTGKIKLLVSSKYASAQVVAKTACHAVIAGTASAVGAHFTSPTSFDWTPAGIAAMKKIALGGAVLAIVHLFMDIPKADKPTQ